MRVRDFKVIRRQADVGRLQIVPNIADQVTARMPPTFHGLMTEEINYAYEGGLYAELIRNRNIKETVPARQNRQNPQLSTAAKEAKDLVHWSLVQEGGTGSMELDTATPLNKAVHGILRRHQNEVPQPAGDRERGHIGGCGDQPHAGSE